MGLFPNHRVHISQGTGTVVEAGGDRNYVIISRIPSRIHFQHLAMLGVELEALALHFVVVQSDCITTSIASRLPAGDFLRAQLYQVGVDLADRVGKFIPSLVGSSHLIVRDRRPSMTCE